MDTDMKVLYLHTNSHSVIHTDRTIENIPTLLRISFLPHLTKGFTLKAKICSTNFKFVFQGPTHIYTMKFYDVTTMVIGFPNSSPMLGLSMRKFCRSFKTSLLESSKCERRSDIILFEAIVA